MIRMSKMTDYAILILAHLARASGTLTAQELATRSRVPLPTVSKLAKELSKAGLVVSHRGRNGGYGLARPAEKISVAEIVESLEGPIALTECAKPGKTDCDIEDTCLAKASWDPVSRAIDGGAARPPALLHRAVPRRRAGARGRARAGPHRSPRAMSTAEQFKDLADQKYRYGFVTEIEEDRVPKGLSEEIVRLISEKKGEPRFMLEWRLEAYRHWLTMAGADLAERPLPADRLPGHRLLLRAEAEEGARVDGRGRSGAARTPSEKLGIPLEEQSGSPASRWTRCSTRLGRDDLQEEARRARHRLLLVLRGGARAPRPRREVPRLGRARTPTTSSPRSTRAVFSDGSFVYVPEGRPLPDGALDLLPDQREGHRPVRADAHRRRRGRLRLATSRAAPRRCATRTSSTPRWSSSSRSTTRPIKYSTVQNWYPGDAEGRGGIYNFVTKRGKCDGARRRSQLDPGRDRLGDHLEVPVLHPPGRRLGRRVLLGRAHEPPAAGRHRHEDDPHRARTPARPSSRRASAPAAARTPTAGS